VYHKLKSGVDNKLCSSQGTISEFINDAMGMLKQHDVVVEDIEGRPKSLRSIHNKLAQEGGECGMKVSPLFDLRPLLFQRVAVVGLVPYSRHKMDAEPLDTSSSMLDAAAHV
jgi:hypothetical protein